MRGKRQAPMLDACQDRRIHINTVCFGIKSQIKYREPWHKEENGVPKTKYGSNTDQPGVSDTFIMSST